MVLDRNNLKDNYINIAYSLNGVAKPFDFLFGCAHNLICVLYEWLEINIAYDNIFWCLRMIDLCDGGWLTNHRLVGIGF